MRILLMSHGPMARGALESAEMIVGKQSIIDVVSVTEDSTIDSTFLDILKTVKQYPGAEWLILTDIIGGTPFNAAYRYIEENRQAAIVSGFNLPLLLELIMRQDSPVSETLAYIDGNKDKTISLVTYQEETKEDEDFDL